MKKALTLILALPLLGLTGGCGHLNLASMGSADRAVTGTVDLSAPAELPADAVLEVRIIDPNPPPPPTPLATSAAPKMAQPPEIVGEVTIHDLGETPYAFHCDFNADDDELQHGLIIEARITYGGRIQYANLSQFMITPDNVGETQHVVVDKL